MDAYRQSARGDEELVAKAELVYRLLRAEYGEPHRPGKGDAVDELIAGMISQHTSDVNTDRAFRNLLATFGDWEAVRDAPVPAIEQTIRAAGLSRVKAPRIKAVLETIEERYGRIDLAHLATKPLGEAKAELTSLPGVGPKTAACALLFGLGLPAMPVDTHVYRVSRRIGLIAPDVSPELAHELLEAMVPPPDVFGFHILMIKHGRVVCKAVRPRCPECVVLPECDYGRQVVGWTSPGERPA